MEYIPLSTAINQLVSMTEKQQLTQVVPLNQGLRRHLAHSVYAPIDVPNFNRAAMDGYAVKSNQTIGASKKTPLTFKVVDQIMAGDVPVNGIKENQVVRIMTGALIPDGFDAVIRQEDTNYGETEVEFYAQVNPYTNYGKKGEDIRQGQLLIEAGTQLTPIHLGILASVGMKEIEVLQPVKVGLISSGSELAQPGEILEMGHIYDSNHYVLAAKLQELGVDVVFTEQIQDDVQMACTKINDLIESVDILLTTGGVSVGKKDIMHDVMSQLGAKRLFWRIQMRPGTPALASLYHNKLILSLSGNPFAALTTFELLFRPVLGKKLQTTVYNWVHKKAILQDDFLKKSGQRRFVRAYYETGNVYLKTSEHASSVLSSMLGCNCFIDIPSETPALYRGAEVNIILLGGI